MPKKGNVLCFVVDTTMSMQDWISAVCTVLSEVVDVATMTRAFDAVGVLEYGDYDSVWASRAHVPNTFSCGDDTAVVRFSGWGIVGTEAKHKRVVMDETSRVSTDDVYTFTSRLIARGGGRAPEAVKSALLHLSFIAKTTLSDTCRVHVIHLTDAPMHLDMKGLDSEGIKEKATIPELVASVLCGLKAPARAAPSAPALSIGATKNVCGPTHAMSVYKVILDSFKIPDTVAEALREDFTQQQKTVPSPSVFIAPSRLHYTCVCSKPLAAGPYGALAHLTGGRVVSPSGVDVASLRSTVQAILNAWMGIKTPSSNTVDPLLDNVCHLVYKTKPAVLYPTTPNEEVVVVADLDLSLTDEKLDSLCKCRRHSFLIPSESQASKQSAAIQRMGTPTINVEIGLKRALQRCLARVLPSAAERVAEASSSRTAEQTKAFAIRRAELEEYLTDVSLVLRRICTQSPMALCSSPPLGKIWRAFTRRREDPRRDEFLALLERAKLRLLPRDLQTFTLWNQSSYVSTDEIQKELTVFVDLEGVKGLIFYDGGDEGFVPQSVNSAFITCEKEAQSNIVKMLTRMRVDRGFTVPSRVERERARQSADESAGMGGEGPSSSFVVVGSRGSSAMYFVDEEEGDEALAEFTDDDGEDDRGAEEALPFPRNALPLNLPFSSIFRLLLSIAIPGTQLSLRPSAIVAALALRSGSVLKVQAGHFLQSIVGKWIRWDMIADDAAQNIDVAMKKPAVPENFVAAFLHTLRSTQKQLEEMQEKSMTRWKERGVQPPDHVVDLLTQPIFTATEYQTLQQLSRLAQLTRYSTWEVTINVVDVSSGNGVMLDYTLECTMCHAYRPWSLVADDGVCGYCKYSQTPEGRHAYGAQRMVNPLFPKQQGGNSRSTMPVRAAPPAVDGNEGTFQVRCGHCHGYYSRCQNHIIVGESRCFYCRAASAPEAAPLLVAALAAPRDSLCPTVTDLNFPHVHRCSICKVGIIGAPTRFLPNRQCAVCKAGKLRKSTTVTERTMRLEKVFPLAYYWRDLAAAVGLETLPHQSNNNDEAAGSVSLPVSLWSAAQLFAIPNIYNGTNPPPQMVPSDFKLNTSMPSDRCFVMLAPSTERRAYRKSIPTLRIENVTELWAKLVTNIFNCRFGGERPMCSICCDEMLPNSLHPACGRRGCQQRLCHECAREWYSVESSGNRLGRILAAPRRLYCPCCARVPTNKILAMYHPDAVAVSLPKAVSELDTDRYTVGWCCRCSKPAIAMEKVCAEAVDDAAHHTANFLCTDCQTRDGSTKHIRSLPVCPGCDAPTYLYAGCYHVTCPCGQHWCYVCGLGFASASATYGHTCGGPDKRFQGLPAETDEYGSDEEW